MKKKKMFIIISIVSVFLIVAIFFGGIAIFLNDEVLKNQILIATPRSYICNYFEKNVPMGSNPDTAIQFLLSNKEWTTGGPYSIGTFEVLHKYDYKLFQCNHIDPSYYFTNYHSFSGINYDSKSVWETSGGMYWIKVDVGATLFEPMWGDHVKAYFIFNEQQKLIDILVIKQFIGY